MIGTVEEAYQKMASVLVGASDEGWEKLEAMCPILRGALGGVETRQYFDGKGRDLDVGFGIFDLQKACLFLRDDLIAKGGERIWGLTFTLFLTGKFSLDYDYSKPDGSEGSDEVIGGDEVNKT